MSKPCLCIVLAEDQRQVTFVRRFLYRLGYRYHDVRVEALPGSRGCGEQWVRKQYPQSVAALRNRHAKTALAVMIDADSKTVEERGRQLSSALAEAGIGLRATDEKIAHFIPKRNVETWVLCLIGQRVDEEQDYKREPNIDHEAIRRAAEEFFEWSRLNAAVPGHCIPSLWAAFPEARRLD